MEYLFDITFCKTDTDAFVIFNLPLKGGWREDVIFFWARVAKTLTFSFRARITVRCAPLFFVINARCTFSTRTRTKKSEGGGYILGFSRGCRIDCFSQKNRKIESIVPDFDRISVKEISFVNSLKMSKIRKFGLRNHKFRR